LSQAGPFKGEQKGVGVEKKKKKSANGGPSRGPLKGKGGQRTSQEKLKKKPRPFQGRKKRNPVKE